METNNPQASDPQDNPKAWVCVLSLLFFPLGGILYFLNRISRPRAARVYGLSCIVGIVIFLFFLLLMNE